MLLSAILACHFDSPRRMSQQWWNCHGSISSYILMASLICRNETNIHCAQQST
jgi:hypothetical protein